MEKELEMPVPCAECDDWVELNETRESPIYRNKMVCKNCYAEHYIIKEIVDEIKDIQYMFDCNDETLKGDRRGWKKNMKDLKNELLEKGYRFDDF